MHLWDSLFEKHNQGLTLTGIERDAYDAGSLEGHRGNDADQTKAWRAFVDANKLKGLDASDYWAGADNKDSNKIYHAFSMGYMDGNNNYQVTHRRIGLAAGVAAIGGLTLWLVKRKR